MLWFSLQIFNMASYLSQHPFDCIFKSHHAPFCSLALVYQYLHSNCMFGFVICRSPSLSALISGQGQADGGLIMVAKRTIREVRPFQQLKPLVIERVPIQVLLRTLNDPTHFSVPLISGKRDSLQTLLTSNFPEVLS